MGLNGTSVVKLTVFLDNLIHIAGTRYITRTEYDANPNKICSYSHINRNFKYRWNEILEQAGIPIKRKLHFPYTQGRKEKDKSKAKVVECLRCLELFESIDPKINRICDKCKNLEDQEENY